MKKAYCKHCGLPVYENDGITIKARPARTIYYHWRCMEKVEEEWKKQNEEKEILQYKESAKN